MILQKIREKIGVMMVVIGFGMLVFILGDLFNSGGLNNLFQDQRSNYIGKVEGDIISEKEFNQLVDNQLNQYPNSTPQTRQYVLENTWNQLINQKLMGLIKNDLGLVVTDDELRDMIYGDNPHIQVQQQFPRLFGMATFNADTLKSRINAIKTNNLEYFDETVEPFFKEFGEELKDRRLSEKINALITKSHYATTAEAKEEFAGENRSFNVQFIAQRATSVSDNDISISDQDLQAYYNTHKEDYKLEEAEANIAYVSFMVSPSVDDRKATRDDMMALAGEFKTANDNTLFISGNSEETFDKSYKPANELGKYRAALENETEPGKVLPVEPNGDRFIITKLTDIQDMADSAKIRQITIIPSAQTQEEVLAKRAVADSLYKILKADLSKFDEINTAHSEDPKKAENGEQGWVKNNMVTPSVWDSLTIANKGDVKLLASNTGFHIVHVQEMGDKIKKYQVGSIVKTIVPSKETTDKIFSEAYNFQKSCGNAAGFDAKVEADANLQKKLAKGIKTNDVFVQQLNNARRLVKWVYTSKPGEVSPVFDLTDQYAVAIVTSKNTAYKALDDVQEEIRAAVTKEKKVAMLADKMNKAMSTAGNDMAAAANELGTTVVDGTNINFQTGSLPGYNEPSVIGKISGMKEGDVSAPFKGNEAVFVVKMIKKDEMAINDNIDFTVQKNRLKGQARFKATSIINDYKEKVEIEDHRFDFIN